MKKSITILTLLAGAAGAYAQGKIVLADYVPATWCIDIFAPQGLGLTQTTGNSQYDNPVGATAYTGVALGGSATGTGPAAYGNGNLWTLAIYAAPGINNAAGIAAAELAGTPVATSLFQTSGGTGAANTGTAGNDSAGVWALNAGSSTATTLAGYTGGATIQLEAWYNGGAANLTYLLSPVKGSSAMESIAALGGTGSPPAVTPNLGSFVPGDGQIVSFSLIGVPEPSTIALGVIGASTLLFRRRK